ncbi:MAG: IPT/TIG domain-containing protein [Planctomycetota bacterium]
MSRVPVRSLALAALAVGAGAALAHIPLKHPGTNAPIFWANEFNVPVVISSAGSDDLDPGEHVAAIRLAIDAWNSVPGAVAHVNEDTNPGHQAWTNWASSSVHLVLFDEDNSSGFFPQGSSTVAITPVWFLGSGAITDADILFNGKQYTFTTSNQPGRYDVQDVATHEFGHFLGFDHSPVAGSSLFPYVTSGLVLHRSLASDDWMAVRARYPFGSYARISGRVVRSDQSDVSYAHLVLRDDDGRSVGAALAAANGEFRFEGVAPGTYELLAMPLDGAVTSANLTGTPAVDVDFQPTSFGNVTVGTNDLSLGKRVVLPDAYCVLGRPFDPLPLVATRGATTTHLLRGAGLSAGSTLLASDPDVTVTVHAWFGSAVSFSLTVPADEEPGHFDLTFENALGERSLLPGAAEIVPPAPVVSSVVPSVANSAGGTTVVVNGSGFRTGCCVVAGGRIYRDGAPGGCVVLSPSQIAFTASPGSPGSYDVVVIDETGVEGRLAGALALGSVPDVAHVFPNAGSSSGGTKVVLMGSGFDPGVDVRIAGVSQSVDYVDASRIEFTTSIGAPGAPRTLVVTNPVGNADTSSFAYVDRPDPKVLAVSPAQGPAEGGVWVTVDGEGLDPQHEVWFGVDPATGLGGTPAESVTVLDTTSLVALAPPGKGVASLVVRNPDTGQASALPAAYVYQSSSRGGCAGLVRDEGPGAPLLRGLWWVAMLLVVVGFGALRARRRLAGTLHRRA